MRDFGDSTLITAAACVSCVKTGGNAPQYAIAATAVVLYKFADVSVAACPFFSRVRRRFFDAHLPNRHGGGIFSQKICPANPSPPAKAFPKIFDTPQLSAFF
ncbi:MAG: hypothetical protein R3C26_14920 [Calditrichia bacterium]